MLAQLVGAAAPIVGGYISDRRARKHMERQSISGRIAEAKRHGINKLVAIGASPNPYVGGQLGGGIAASAGAIGDAAARRSAEKERALDRQNLLQQKLIEGQTTLQANKQRIYGDLLGRQMDAYNHKNAIRLSSQLQHELGLKGHESRMRTEHEFNINVRPQGLGDVWWRSMDWLHRGWEQP